MSNLLRANMTRVFKNRTFQVCAGFMALYAAAVCLIMYRSMIENNITIPFEDVFISAYGIQGFIAVPGIVMAAFVSVFVGTEYSDGTIRNKIIVGRTRRDIYLSNFIICAAGGVLLNVIYMAVAFAMGIPMFGFFTAEASVIGKITLAGTLMIISYAAVFNLLAMLIQNKTTAAIISLVGVVAVMFTCTLVISMLLSPEMVDSMEMVNGQQVWTKVPNPRYLTGLKREIYQFIVDFFPSGQSLQLSGMSAVHLVRMAVYSGIIIIVTNVAGVLSFSRKDLK